MPVSMWFDQGPETSINVEDRSGNNGCLKGWEEGAHPERGNLNEWQTAINGGERFNTREQRCVMLFPRALGGCETIVRIAGDTLEDNEEGNAHSSPEHEALAKNLERWWRSSILNKDYPKLDCFHGRKLFKALQLVPVNKALLLRKPHLLPSPWVLSNC